MGFTYEVTIVVMSYKKAFRLEGSQINLRFTNRHNKRKISSDLLQKILNVNESAYQRKNKIRKDRKIIP